MIGSDVTLTTAEIVLDRMLAAGGEMVTLVLGDEAPASVADHWRSRVRESTWRWTRWCTGAGGRGRCC